MIIQGEVIEVKLDTDVKKRGGGTYKGSLLVYRDMKEGKITEKAFHSTAFKVNPALKVALQGFTPGDLFDMIMEKNGEFWNVVELKASGGKADVMTGQAAPQMAKERAKSSFDERDEKRQLYIIRQSSIGHAVSLLAANGGKKNTPDEVLDIADKFVDFVFNGKQHEASMEDVNTMLNQGDSEVE